MSESIRLKKDDADFLVDSLTVILFLYEDNLNKDLGKDAVDRLFAILTSIAGPDHLA